MHRGFVALHRKMVDWEWYSDINVFRLFTHLILTANWKSKRWQGEIVNRGQKVVSIQNLAQETGLTEQSVRTAIKKLKSTGELTSKSTNKYTVVTLTNYELYQSEEKQATSKSTSELTNEEQTTNKQLTTTKQLNNITIKQKKERKESEILPSDYYQKTLKALGLPSTGIISLRDHTVLVELFKKNCNFDDIEQARIKRKKNRLEWIQDTVCEMRDARLATVAKPDENGIPILPNGYMDWDNMTFEQKQFAIQRGYEK